MVLDMAKKSQVQKFRDAARELGCDESDERFEEALRAVAKHKAQDNPKPSSRDEDKQK
jgi:hypothetical protein